MTRFLNAILILTILVAGGRLMMRAQQYRSLTQERNQLVEKLDGFRVQDPNRYLVQMVDTDEPMLFKWRIHVPSGFRTACSVKVGDKGGAYFSSARFDSEDKLENVSIRLGAVDDAFYIDMQTLSNGHRLGYSDVDLDAFCRQHWSDLDIEILGQQGPVEIDVDQEVVLLSIKISDELLSEMETKFGKKLAGRFSKQSFCRFSFGEHAMIERVRQSQGGLR